MSIDQTSLERVKAALGIELPGEYERLVRDFPPDIPDAEEYDISTNADWLIQHNVDLRADPAFFFSREQPWPRHLYIFGEDGNGNAFYLDLREGPSPAVYFLDHEQPDTDHIVAARSISEWLTQVRAHLEEYRANAMALEAVERRRPQFRSESGRQARPKPWWQFWRR